jgi:hypothetical protein
MVLDPHRLHRAPRRLVIAPLTDGEIEAACSELYARHEEFQQPYRWLVSSADG